MRRTVIVFAIALPIFSACSSNSSPVDLGILKDSAPGDTFTNDLEIDGAADVRVPDAASATEIAYDDGTAEGNNSPWEAIPGGQLAVSFTPPFYPCVIKSAKFFVTAGGVPTTEFAVRIYAAPDASTPPQSELLAVPVKAKANGPDEWVTVDLRGSNITVTQGDFVVAMEWLTAAGVSGQSAQFLGSDESSPDTRSWWLFAAGGNWTPIKNVGSGTGDHDRDLLIRATVRSE